MRIIGGADDHGVVRLRRLPGSGGTLFSIFLKIVTDRKLDVFYFFVRQVET